MTIVGVSGDLFENRNGAQALAHGCNCMGVMGAGIAVRFKRKYPKMFLEYRRLCRSVPRRFNPGDVFLWKEAGKPFVFNLGTQEFPGRAIYAAIEQSLVKMRKIADDEGITSIAIPRIGSGCGGLRWEGVREIIEKVFGQWSGDLFVYEKYTKR